MRLNNIFSYCILAICSIVLVSCNKKEITIDGTEIPSTNIKAEQSAKLKLWYSDDMYTEYLKKAVKNFKKEYGIKVKLYQKSSIDMQQEIAQGDKEGPDVYIISNDKIGRAIATGNASINTQTEIYNTGYVKGTALSAATYLNELYGYPIGGDTVVMVYNAELVTSAAATFDEILEFANQYEDADGMSRQILKWNVNDAFINYTFIGAYAKMYGKNGDDKKDIDVYNKKVIQSLEYYQKLNQYFSIDANTINNEQLIQEFKNGSIVFMMIRASDLKKLENCSFHYGVNKVPNLTNKLKTKPISITDVAVVNSTTQYANASNLFAHYIAINEQTNLNKMTGKIPMLNVLKDNHEVSIGSSNAYDNSKPIPKLLSFGEYWVELDILLNNIWKGSNIEEEIFQLTRIK